MSPILQLHNSKHLDIYSALTETELQLPFVTNGISAKTLEEIESVECYVKNQFLGFTIPYTKDGQDREYFTDFIARVKSKDGNIKNLMIEINGMSKDKAEKKWSVENR